MALSMFLLNNRNSWAWRLPGAILGIASVFIVYLLGIRLLNKRSAALIAAFTFSIDGLNFVQSRVGMNDIYFVTFILVCLLLLLNRKYTFSAILLGLAISSKWTAIYFLSVIIFLLFRDKRIKKIFLFIIVPPIIYLISYLPFFLLGHTFDQFIQLQQQMWWYHTGLKATHAYSSPWWSWPLNLYPVWYFVDYQKNTISNIFTSGNSIMFWAGSACVLLTIFEAIKKRATELYIIILAFLTFWLPWSISPRIMFLYHFSPSVPFLALCLGHQINQGLSDKKIRFWVITLLVMIFLNFILFLPILTGIPISRNLIDFFFMTNLSKNPF